MSSQKNTIKNKETQSVITDEEREKYHNDIISFFQNEIYVDDNQPIRLEPWQRKLLRRIFEPRRRRRPDVRQFRIALIMIPKKNGKSTIAAGLAIWALLCDDPNPEVYICSGDLDQSRVIFRMIEFMLRRNERLKKLVYVKKDLIERNDQRGFLKAMASDADTAHGTNPSFVIFDELWNQQSERLFSAMTLPPTRKEPMSFIISYAGYDKDSLLYRLYQMGKKKTDRQMFFFHSTDNLASWVSKEYLKRQKIILPPFEYARMHEAKWTDAQNAFLDSADIDKCVDRDLLPNVKADPRFLYFLGLDLGLKNDRTVATITHYDYNLEAVVLDEIAFWEGTQQTPVDVKTVEDYILDAHQRFNFNKIICDPWQAMQLIQNLRSKRLPIEEFSFSGQNVNRLASNIFNLFHNRRIKIFEHKNLINELKTVQATQTSYGFRIDHRSGKHDDFVISLGLAALFAVQYQKPKTLPEVWFFGPKDDDF